VYCVHISDEATPLLLAAEQVLPSSAVPGPPRAVLATAYRRSGAAAAISAAAGN